MKNILKELWFGNIYPAEDALKMTPEMRDLGCLVERNREDLMSTLTERQKEIFETFAQTRSNRLPRELVPTFLGTIATIGSYFRDQLKRDF